MIKQLFKLVMAIHIFLYRLTGGRFGGKIQTLNVLLLTTTGRKSGKERTTPLGYFDHDGGFVISASSAGSPHNPGWYYNLKSNPQVTIQIKERVIPVIATEAEGDLRTQLWAQLIEKAPGFLSYQERTTRQIPMIILQPK